MTTIYVIFASNVMTHLMTSMIYDWISRLGYGPNLRTIYISVPLQILQILFYWKKGHLMSNALTTGIEYELASQPGFGIRGLH